MENIYILLECPCPVTICNQNKQVRYWQHNNCGGHLCINCKGMVRCNRCGETRSITQCKFSCSNHMNQFQTVDIWGLSHSLSRYRTASDSMQHRQWFSSLHKTLITMVDEVTVKTERYMLIEERLDKMIRNID